MSCRLYLWHLNVWIGLFRAVDSQSLFTEFTLEATLSAEKEGQRSIRCRCPAFPETRIPCCECDRTASLFQVRWKRLVVDEGHNVASRSTSLVHFYKSLNVERKWIVTGTPTTNLLGINLGSTHISDEDEEVEEDESEGSQISDCPARKWTKDDRLDRKSVV